MGAGNGYLTWRTPRALCTRVHYRVNDKADLRRPEIYRDNYILSLTLSYLKNRYVYYDSQIN